MKKWTKEEIRENLENKDAWVFRGITAIYHYQTEYEKKITHSCEMNGVGFNRPDGHYFDSWAKHFIRLRKEDRTPELHPGAVKKLRKRILKYAGQLAKIANKEI